MLLWSSVPYDRRLLTYLINIMQHREGYSEFPHSSGSNGLEDHLRNLILTNATPGNGGGPVNTTQAASTLPSNPIPHQGLSQPSTSDVSYSSSHPAGAAPLSPKVARKRPNQAQRRQMNAQLSIPIDPRPSPPTQYGRPFSGSPGNSNNLPGFYSHQKVARTHHAQPVRSSAPGLAHGNYGSAPHTHRQHGHHPGSLDVSRNHQGQTRYGPRQDQGSPRYPRNAHGTLYSPRSSQQVSPEELESQAAFLERLCSTLVAGAEIERQDIAEKEAFRVKIEAVCRAVVSDYEILGNGVQDFPPSSVALKCFGSLSSGFATKASDMDLGLISPFSQTQPDAAGSQIPRLIEKAFLDVGLGARLLTRTRVPIIKLCEKPPERLRLDLLEERLKWERGIDEPEIADGLDDEDHVDNKYDNANSAEDQKLELPPLASPPSTRPSGVPALYQPENTSSQAYYNAAKRALRRLGGRDITLSNWRELTQKDYELLNGICEAFTQGLRSQELKSRLAAYRSLSFKALPDAPNYHSLACVNAQVEGESIVMLCEAEPDIAIAGPEAVEAAALDLFTSWKTLLDQPYFGLEPMTFSKSVQLLLEKIKKLPIAQLLTLEQNQHEPVSSYEARTLKIISQLRPSTPEKSDNANKTIIERYTAGIWPNTIRAKVREFVDGCPERISITTVARRHKSVQLASELEKALDHSMYEPQLEPSIKEYIDILRGPMHKGNTGDPHYDYVVPVTKENCQTIRLMRELKDPSKMTVNQARDPYRDKLEFPKSGVGVQCDINFSAHLALQNTLLLRCYSHTDPRVRPLVLFVKHWAKVRSINTPYRGTLSSYGYVLMMLHYLVNVVQPFVCPNLQQLGPPPPPAERVSPTASDDAFFCRGRFVGFWRDEAEIIRLAQMGQLNSNRESVGHLLRGFFEYYAQNGSMSTYPGRGFDWGRDVLSIRTPGGLLSKSEKGWTGAKTVIEYRPNAAGSPVADTPPPNAAQFALKSPGGPPTPTADAAAQEAASPTVASKPTAASHKTGEVKEVRHRYLFAIEDPFELEHNVARTVTHNGIVAIRDEFRRAWRIIKAAGTGNFAEELLKDTAALKEEDEKSSYLQLLDEIHGWELFE
ncbi:Terminal uridylyltransferase cid1 [Colletotrichum spinosum]|uniref:polynucleotide adenylyltransferase n=1 Tax=Colletotrichum spinosum TaxID=1347390 RepID=A0A4R8QAQ3_9PEZI|nr:Terminal uridylyltransferase cid1 [Colletotrichum spinosum]